MSNANMTNTDPRAVRSRQAILDAVRWILLNEGPDRITHQRVAEVAEVGRATVYRHWKTADDMVLALLDEDPFRLLRVHEEDSLEDRLVAWITWITTLLADPHRRLVILHVLARTELNERANRLRTRRIGELMANLNVSIGERGGWNTFPPARKRDGISLLVGPLFMQVVFMATPPDEDWVREVVQHFIVWLDQQPPQDRS